MGPGLKNCLAGWLLLGGIASITGCGGGDEPELNGYLYFAAGSYLGVFNLETGDVNPVSNFGAREITWLIGMLTRKEPFDSCFKTHDADAFSSRR